MPAEPLSPQSRVYLGESGQRPGRVQQAHRQNRRAQAGDGEVDPTAIDTLDARFRAALDNDLHTSRAVTALYDVLKYKTNDATKLAALDRFDAVLGLDLTAKAAAKREELKKQDVAAQKFAVVFDGCDVDPEIEKLAEARTAAKKAKNFAEADRIRAEVLEKGYVIEDTPTGPKVKKA